MSHRSVLGLALGIIVGLLAPSLGRAAETACSTCHPGGTASSHHDLPGYACGQCHGSAPVAGPCASCHTGPSEIHHLLSGYTCSTCHPGWNFTPQPCTNCHAATTPTTGHHDPAVLATRLCTACHSPDPNVGGACSTCHGGVDTAHADCLVCHASPIGPRRGVGPEFAAASHHIRVAKPTKADCSACHDLGAHMGGTVWLKNADGGPSVAYTTEDSATAACLSCHDENSKTSQPFSDGRTPSSSWDGASVALKYSSTEVVSSNKYPPTAPAPNMGGQLYNTLPDVKRSLSAHGNPIGNLANGSALDQRVPCLGCHNAHGSSAPGLRFTSATYQPATEEAFCWDCHTNAPAAPRKAWDYLPNDRVRDYFGDSRWGMNDGTGFKADWMGNFVYKDGPFKSSHFHPSKRKISNTNWPRSTVTCTNCHDPHGVNPNLTATKGYMVPLLKGTWLISPFKEDRAPLTSFASSLRDGSTNRYQNADQPRGNPDLPYNNPPNPGGGHSEASGGAGHEGYFIEDNTFGVYNPSTSAPAKSGDWKSLLAGNQTLKMNRIAEPDTLFAGLCLQCHPKSGLLSGWSGHGTVKGWGGAQRDLFPKGLAAGGGEEGPGLGMHAMGKYSQSGEDGLDYGRGYRWGVNPKAQQTTGYVQADYHQFTCSKCHSPHATNMPRLLVTNCLDSKGNHTVYSKARSAQANTCHSTSRNLAWNTLTPWVQTEVPVKHTIVATSTNGGTVAPEGISLVTTGGSQTYTVTTESGYALSYVKVNGVSQGAITSYTFNNVTADQTISATFTSTNLALSKTATASSTRSSTYAATKAVDGNTTTSWMSSSTSSAQWVRVDLGSSRSISFVQVTWPATYYARAFRIETSTDGTNFIQQYSTTTATGGVTYAIFPAVNARYVRIYCTSPNNSSYYGVAELDVRATAPHNNPPVANAGADKTATAGTAISFTGSGTDADGTVVSYSWNWGDGTADTPTQNASHTYTVAGSYTATLTVTDNRGAAGEDTALVTINPPPPNQPPTANAGPDKTGTAGTAISFTGAGTDPDGTIAGYSWQWGDGTANTNTQNASHAYAAPGVYTATLTVTDNAGGTGIDAALVTVSAAPPPNLALNKTASASSTRTGTSYTAAKAVDGSTSTSWMSSSTSGTQWVRVDLGSSQSIANVKVVWPATYFAKAFKIETSTDGTNFTQRYAATNGTGGVTNVTFAPVSARYVRVSCTTRNNSSYYGVSELEVYP